MTKIWHLFHEDIVGANFSNVLHLHNTINVKAAVIMYADAEGGAKLQTNTESMSHLHWSSVRPAQGAGRCMSTGLSGRYCLHGWEGQKTQASVCRSTTQTVEQPVNDTGSTDVSKSNWWGNRHHAGTWWKSLKQSPTHGEQVITQWRWGKKTHTATRAG